TEIQERVVLFLQWQRDRLTTHLWIERRIWRCAERCSSQHDNRRNRPRGDVRLQRSDIHSGRNRRNRKYLFTTGFAHIDEWSAVEARVCDRIIELIIRAHVLTPEVRVPVHDERATASSAH